MLELHLVFLCEFKSLSLVTGIPVSAGLIGELINLAGQEVMLRLRPHLALSRALNLLGGVASHWAALVITK